MLKAIKIKLNPTPEQEVLFWKSAGTARWAYNFYLSEKERVYQEYLANGTDRKDITTSTTYSRRQLTDGYPKSAVMS